MAYVYDFSILEYDGKQEEENPLEARGPQWETTRETASSMSVQRGGPKSDTANLMLSSEFHMHTMACAHPHTWTHNKININKVLLTTVILPGCCLDFFLSCSLSLWLDGFLSGCTLNPSWLFSPTDAGDWTQDFVMLSKCPATKQEPQPSLLFLFCSSKDFCFVITEYKSYNTLFWAQNNLSLLTTLYFHTYYVSIC